MGFILLLAVLAGPPNLLWTSVPSGGITAVENAGDIDSDGTDDVFATWSESLNTGAICFSGLNGSVIWTSDAVPGTDTDICLKAIPDVNSDGKMDLAVGTASDSSLTVLSGIDGTVVWSVPISAPIRAVEFSSGPGGDVAVLGNSVSGPELWCHFFGLEGGTGTELWAASPQSSDDFYIKTGQDVSGNGWSEMAYSIDRGSAYTGYVDVRDGYTGTLLQSSETIYFPSVDISDSPGFMAVSHFGYPPDLWVEDISTGTINWSIEDQNLCGNEMQFIQNIDEPDKPCPELLSWYSNKLILIRGDDGFYQNWYIFPNFLVAAASFQEETQWKLAVITSTGFHCPVLNYSASSTEPSIPLPGPSSCDMCLLESVDYPTPLAAIAMDGSGPGVCTIATSWPVSTGDETEPVPDERPVVILDESPCNGGIHFGATSRAQVDVLDVSGRLVRSVQTEEGSSHFLELPPGLYFLRYDKYNPGAVRAVVL